MSTGIQDKAGLSERDICTKFVTPALVAAGWDLQSQLREEVTFTAGRVIVRGTKVTRGQARRADYVLYYKPGMPLAVIEAKDNGHSVGAGMQQALTGAEALDAPFAFSTNGDAFSFAEQKRNVAKVNELMALCDALEAKLTQSRADADRLVAAVVHALGVVPKMGNKP
jgi:type I restriction enzyme, R subunit